MTHDGTVVSYLSPDGKYKTELVFHHVWEA
jgi:hypothetical protein